MSCKREPIKNRPNGIDDDTIDRGVTGQGLRDKEMHYDPATGKRTGGTDVNLNVPGEMESYGHEGMEDE